MSDPEGRKEPVFSEPHDGDERFRSDPFDSRLPPRDRDPRLRLAAFAVVFVCSVIFIEWGVQKYLEYRAIQAMNAALVELEASSKASAERARLLEARAREEAERRRLALREQRANTNQGKWLAKTCSDWRRAHEDIGGPTAEREMRRHCRVYEEYLDTGIAVTPVR
jgi:hypothetical protein